MAKKEKELTHDIYTLDGLKIEKSEGSFDLNGLQIIIPKGTPYVKIRKALETALLRIR